MHHTPYYFHISMCYYWLFHMSENVITIVVCVYIIVISVSNQVQFIYILHRLIAIYLTIFKHTLSDMISIVLKIHVPL